MLKPIEPRQNRLERVVMEDLVPSDHLLRKLDRYLQFDFIRDQVKSLYCENNGRLAVDPVLMFKSLFIGYLFGVRTYFVWIIFLSALLIWLKIFLLPLASKPPKHDHLHAQIHDQVQADSAMAALPH